MSVSDVYAKEKTLEREIAPAIERSLPGVEVLALELVSPSRFCVYVDHPGGVDHALCERVTQLLDDYRGSTASTSPRRGLSRRSASARTSSRRSAAASRCERAAARRHEDARRGRRGRGARR